MQFVSLGVKRGSKDNVSLDEVGSLFHLGGEHGITHQTSRVFDVSETLKLGNHENIVRIVSIITSHTISTKRNLIAPASFVEPLDASDDDALLNIGQIANIAKGSSLRPLVYDLGQPKPKLKGRVTQPFKT